MYMGLMGIQCTIQSICPIMQIRAVSMHTRVGEGVVQLELAVIVQVQGTALAEVERLDAVRAVVDMEVQEGVVEAVEAAEEEVVVEAVEADVEAAVARELGEFAYGNDQLGPFVFLSLYPLLYLAS